MIFPSIRAVIFDMDGTIISSEDIWRASNEQILQQEGVASTSPECVALLDSMHGRSPQETWGALKKKYTLAAPAEQLMQTSYAHAMNIFKEKVNFIHGFEQFHQTLVNNGIGTAIATNSSLDNLEFVARELNFHRFFKTNLFSATHVNNRPKPDPALFLYAVEKLNQKPEDCLIFEDSLAGFIAAKEAGIRCIAIKNRINELHRHLVHSAIDSYDEAYDILKKL